MNGVAMTLEALVCREAFLLACLWAFSLHKHRSIYLLVHAYMICIKPLLSVLCLAISRRPNIQRCHVFHYPVFPPHLHSMEGPGLRQSTKEDLFWYSMFRHSGYVSQPPHAVQHYNFSNHLSHPKHLPNLR